MSRSHPSVHDLPPCPVCGQMPEVERCGPWPKSLGPAPWYIGCYRLTPREHFIGDNADTLDDANRVWRDAVIKARRVASVRVEPALS